MATLTLEVNEDLLQRAESEARRRGSDLRGELLARVEALSRASDSSQSDALKRLIELSDANPTYLVGGMPNREERNAR